MDEKKMPTSLAELTDKEYLPDNPQCPDGRQLSINVEGKIEIAGGSENP